jgi:hypothetical protein
MKIIIIMCWSIWTERNSWIFRNEAPSIQRCIYTFKSEFALVIHKAKKKLVLSMEESFLRISFRVLVNILVSLFSVCSFMSNSLLFVLSLIKPSCFIKNYFLSSLESRIFLWIVPSTRPHMLAQS